ncbi:MAG: hypothetical protein IKR68_07470 [Lachnospiraceae bacterium]|nr:hypothetical protein [Lachnospiraceae bacterium]
MDSRKLKLFAMAVMAVDHFAMGVVYLLVKADPSLREVYEILRHIGRLAFPIFGLLLVEGFVHTKNIRRYVTAMALGALVSEIPFNLASSRGDFLFPRQQNVFISLFIALCALCVIKFIEDHFEKHDMLRYDLILAAILLFAIMARLIRCDYKQGGIIMICLMYLIREAWYEKSRITGPALPMILAGCTVLTLYSKSEIYAFFVAPLAIMYNGKRGNIKHKYFYYWFYPVHLLIIGIAARIIRQGGL